MNEVLFLLLLLLMYAEGSPRSLTQACRNDVHVHCGSFQREWLRCLLSTPVSSLEPTCQRWVDARSDCMAQGASLCGGAVVSECLALMPLEKLLDPCRGSDYLRSLKWAFALKTKRIRRGEAPIDNKKISGSGYLYT